MRENCVAFGENSRKSPAVDLSTKRDNRLSA